MTYGNIYEYRGVVFYPNGSQTVDISKLYVDYNNTNSFSIYIFYKNATIYLPYPKNITVDLPPQEFKIAITISASRISKSDWEVYYKINNNYPYNILFNVSFPNGFSIKNTSILVPANSYKIITLSKTLNSDTLYFGESNVSFDVPATVKIRYSLPIPFSIIKSNRILDNGSIEWTATYIIKNDKTVPLNVNVSYWAVINNKKINFGNYSYTLSPNENITQSFKLISDDVPIFYLRFYAWRDIYENIKIKPALKVGNSYIIGIGKVDGLSFNIPYVEKNEEEKENKKGEKKEKWNEKTGKEKSSKITEQIQKQEEEREETPQSKNKKESFKNEGYEQQEERKYPVIIKEKDEEKIKKVVAATVATITTTSLTLMLVPPIFRRRPDIADKGVFTIEELKMLNSTVYIPEGCKLGKILPGGITIIKLTDAEKELARDLHEIYDIPLNSAKAIVLGVRYGGRVFLSNKKAWRLAIKIGLEAYLFKEKR
ncbi:hypothetical protein [Methanocaldococcus sp. FS406-22]|uniref:hypothetical protein n=1 Tax=Methanocaldococcus sp. (strain FS406-22) TaxID=644281 RepID=UPI001E57A08A|nr:hypothetical protein [Methanocaldococcus sp. FS406-22]